MKLIRHLLPLLAVFLVLNLSGCKNVPLDPNGVYHGDVAAYTADNEITKAETRLNKALAWGEANPTTVAKIGELGRALTTIRDNKDKWLDSAFSAFDAFHANPTSENKTAYDTAVNVMKLALAEVAKYAPQAATE